MLVRIMMIGPYPGSPDKIDGGAASALTYLSQELVNDRALNSSESG